MGLGRNVTDLQTIFSHLHLTWSRSFRYLRDADDSSRSHCLTELAGRYTPVNELGASGAHEGITGKPVRIRCGRATVSGKASLGATERINAWEGEDAEGSATIRKPQARRPTRSRT
jgi:hypothetical protein